MRMTLADYLALKGISRTRFAEMMGVPVSTISRLADHGMRPNIETAIAIEDFTNGVVDARSFVIGAKPAPKPTPADFEPHNPKGHVDQLHAESVAAAEERALARKTATRARQERAAKRAKPKRKRRASGKG